MSGYWTVTGARNRFRKVTPIARPTAPMSWVSSPQKRGGRPPPLPSTGASRGDPEPGREQQQDRRRHQELPRDREDLVHADPHEAPPHPRDEQEHEHGLHEEPERSEPRRTGPEPAAEEEERPEEARPQHVRVLAELDQRKLHAAVLDPEARHELRLRLEDVERHPVLRGQGRDHER